MQLSPLQLMECSFESVDIRAVEGYDNSKREPRFPVPPEVMRLVSDVGVATLREAEHSSDYGLRFTLTVTAEKPASIPYELRISIAGSVRMHGEPDRDKRQKLALVNGVSLLCGVVRDLVATVTSRSRHGQMLLPTFNFSQLAEQQALAPTSTKKVIANSSRVAKAKVTRSKAKA